MSALYLKASAKIRTFFYSANILRIFFCFFMLIFEILVGFLGIMLFWLVFLGMFYKLLNMVDVAPTRFAICEQVRIALV